MALSWKQLSVNCALADVDHLVRVAQALGAQAITQQNAGEDSYYDLATPGAPRWQQQKVTALFEGAQFNDSLLLTLQSEVDEGSIIRVENLDDQDWERAWQDQYTAVEIDNGLWVCPSWIEQSFPPDATIIKIDPGLAFGTGIHETTQLCMQFLNQMNCENCTVLDYGCGSGILAITALKLGASAATGIDIDPKAEAVSVDNCVTNQVAQQFTIVKETQLKEQRFDIVIANILAGALIDLQSRLEHAVAKNGNLILSGILSHQVESIKEAYAEYFTFETMQNNEWVALAGKRKRCH